MLEGMLLEKGVQPPPAVHPPKSRHEAPMPTGMPHGQQKDLDERLNAPEVPSPPESGTEDCKEPSPKGQSSSCLPETGVEDAIQRLLSVRGTHSFDQFAGRLRFFGPTFNPLARQTEPTDDSVCREPPEQVRRAENIIRSLTGPTHDYLMNNFWTHYNSVLRVVHRETFESSRESQDPKFYSPLLHVSILAMGFRFADPGREDTRRIALANRESSLHREAKRMLEVVLERSGGIPSVQALLLLSDLECGVGRNHTGWMYAGMANRLAFDIGLHIDSRENGIGEHEADVRHTVMRACVVYDRYWALFLGRPTSIKTQDIGINLPYRGCSQKLASLAGRPGHANTTNDAAEIYDYLVELMELAGCILETGDRRQARDALQYNAYVYAIDLHHRLQKWYRRLPEHLRWKPANSKHAPLGYFLLHQQYHVSMILLHRPWAMHAENGGDDKSTGPYSTPDSSSASVGPSNQHLNDPPETKSPHLDMEPGRTASSRRICDFHATCVAKIFWQHRQKFDGTKIVITAVQHAVTAVIALVAAATYTQSDSDRRKYLAHLDILKSAISDMGRVYEPAASMEALLKVALMQLRSNIGNPSDSCRPPVAFTDSEHGSLLTSGGRRSVDSVHLVVPARREANTFDAQPYKRRRLSAPSRGTLGFDRPTLPYLTEQSKKSPRRSSQSYCHVGSYPSFGLNALTTSDSDGSGFNLALFNRPSSELHGPLGNNINPREESSLVTTPSDSWQINTLDESVTPMSEQGDFGYDELMSEHDSGTTSVGFDSPSISHDLVRGSEDIGPKTATVSRRLRGDQMTQSNTESKTKNQITSPVADFLCHGGMGWIGGENALNTVCSVSLGELVQDSIADAVVRDRARGAPRNHELDFLSL
ncbi:fungal specific transcription factor domain-containing protein [Colletotrichum graminicola]|uniref:Fungal specific transcription factor domain-containing protein n=1 Tax=Colletotrichum graminicola (strain M1.001 / M2 / FGSC 10212) TaxID=645133 RepID=E3QM57_COLGM|nr:fungal specific transcription factor domain-containing protein [Colletotrichum graminicola M1.001]EFQ31945.1 fungal specific transcription factor domain-containing protein [Colletotrichum graminicola M1.001]WDK21831.1 fungal specific transcription factor domain-containing protein [Colletotrichum graminicola]